MLPNFALRPTGELWKLPALAIDMFARR
jgi:hypothetical protein